MAAFKGRTEDVQRLFADDDIDCIEQRGGDDKCTPIFAAASEGHYDVVLFLIKKGAIVDSTTETGGTPLSEACDGGWYEIIELLLAHGANASHALKGGMTILHRVLQDGDVNYMLLVKMLVNAGADINAKSDTNDTPLHMAVQAGNFKSVEFLLEMNVCLDGINDAGLTPLELALDFHEHFEEDNEGDVHHSATNYWGEIADILRLEQLRRLRCETFCMGQHERLGVGSLIRWLDPEMTRLVLQWV
jgi:Ankyrin repeats (3 copies)/Ankyrin repeats (many copies)